MKTRFAIAWIGLLSLTIVSIPVALAQRTVVYEPAQTRLDSCVNLCRRGPSQFYCSGACTSRTADGGFPRDFQVDAEAATMGACLTALTASCVP